MCNCIQETEKRFTDLLMKHAPGARITEQVEIQNKSLMLGSGEWRMFSPIEGRYVESVPGRVHPPKIKKFGQKLLYKFCPFCGEAITPEP